MTSQKSSFLLMLAICSTISLSLPQLRQPTWPSLAQAGGQTNPFGRLASNPQPAPQSSPSTYQASSTMGGGLLASASQPSPATYQAPPRPPNPEWFTPLSNIVNFDWVKRWWEDNVTKRPAGTPSTQLAIASEADRERCKFPQVGHEGNYNNFPTPNTGLALKGKLIVGEDQGFVQYQCRGSQTGSSTVPNWVRVGARAKLHDKNGQHVATYTADYTSELQRPRLVQLVNQKTKKVVFRGVENERGPRRSDLDPALIKSPDSSDSRVLYRLNNVGGRQLKQTCEEIGATKDVPFQAEFWMYAEPKAAGFPGLTDDKSVEVACAGSQPLAPSTRT